MCGRLQKMKMETIFISIKRYSDTSRQWHNIAAATTNTRARARTQSLDMLEWYTCTASATMYKFPLVLRPMKLRGFCLMALSLRTKSATKLRLPTPTVQYCVERILFFSQSRKQGVIIVVCVYISPLAWTHTNIRVPQSSNMNIIPNLQSIAGHYWPGVVTACMEDGTRNVKVIFCSGNGRLTEIE